MESSYMKLYKKIASKKNKIKYNKSRQNSKQQLKKNKSLTYYHYDGQINYINKFQINDINNNNKIIYNNKKILNNTNNTNNSSYFLYNEYEYNDNLLFKAYKKSVSELFKTLKLYMNNELYKYDKLKRKFLNNIQKFYNDEKNKEKYINRNKTPNNNNIKSYSKKKLKGNDIKTNENIIINNSKLHKNKSGYNTSLNNFINNNNIYDKFIKTYKFTNKHKSSHLEEHLIKKNRNNNKSINGEPFQIIALTQNQYNNNPNFNTTNNHKSLYTLIKKNKNILVNSPIKHEGNNRNDNIMKKFIRFSKNINDNKNAINKTCNQSIIENNKLNLNEKNNDNCKVSEKTTKNNELISKIKDSLDDNLKHIFNFSYENFLNKESERECN